MSTRTRFIYPNSYRKTVEGRERRWSHYKIQLEYTVLASFVNESLAPLMFSNCQILVCNSDVLLRLSVVSMYDYSYVEVQVANDRPVLSAHNLKP